MSQFAEAEARIRQLYAHYADAVWRKDVAAFADCFAVDAEWRISGMVMHGRDEIADAFEHIIASAKRVLMTFETPLLALDEGGAAARVRVTERCAWTDRPSHFNIGTYFDRIVEDGDRWRYSWRLFQLFYMGPQDLSGSFHDNPDYGPAPNMPPLDAVPLAFSA
jgi:uncharacterized protein (TIGR02246 family)